MQQRSENAVPFEYENDPELWYTIQASLGESVSRNPKGYIDEANFNDYKNLDIHHIVDD